ncbi:hypothetical protein C8Q79DRAFT_1004184 [Trametes meyenii]|nr:hypothetical protein C8Q79DRAFT_1004184 [Trametes meyenii]
MSGKRAGEKLADQNTSAAAAIVYQALDGTTLDNPSRFRLYERSVSSFLRHGDVMKAAMLYSRMTREGYIPSIPLRVQMHIVKLAELSVPEDTLLNVMREGFAQQTFDEVALRDLLRILVEQVEASPTFLRQVVENFLRTREAGYTLSNDTTTYLMGTAPKGDEESVKYWSAYPSAPLPPDPEQPSYKPTASAYTSLLRNLAATKPTLSLYKWTIERMQAENITPDLPFFNALIAYEVGRYNFEVAFSIYRLLMEMRTSTDKPQAHTFSTIFRAIHRLSCSHRYRRLHRVRIPENMPSPRAVFRDMLTCHLEHTHHRPDKPSPSVDRICTHKALRTFMARRDYAAAYTVVRTFRLFPTAFGPAGLPTYRIVLGGLLGRMETEYPLLTARLTTSLEPDSIWTYRFLGMAQLPLVQRSAVALDLGMVYRLLQAGTDPRLSLDFVPAPDYARAPPAPEEELVGQLDDIVAREGERLDQFAGAARFRELGMPTPAEFMRMRPVPEGTSYEVAPLERILRRAIAASLPRTGEPLEEQVSKEIVEAKEEMAFQW